MKVINGHTEILIDDDGSIKTARELVGSLVEAGNRLAELERKIIASDARYEASLSQVIGQREELENDLHIAEHRIAELESKLSATHDLPRITDDIWADFKDTGLLNFDDEPGPTCGQVTWSQLAHDFVAMLDESDSNYVELLSTCDKQKKRIAELEHESTKQLLLLQSALRLCQHIDNNANGVSGLREALALQLNSEIKDHLKDKTPGEV